MWLCHVYNITLKKQLSFLQNSTKQLCLHTVENCVTPVAFHLKKHQVPFSYAKRVQFQQMPALMWVLFQQMPLFVVWHDIKYRDAFRLEDLLDDSAKVDICTRIVSKQLRSARKATGLIKEGEKPQQQDQDQVNLLLFCSSNWRLT